jgi:hypothetical protein
LAHRVQHRGIADEQDVCVRPRNTVSFAPLIPLADRSPTSCLAVVHAQIRP